MSVDSARRSRSIRGAPSTFSIRPADEQKPEALALSATNVALTWNAVGGATSYKVLRSANGSTYSEVGNPASNSFNDSTATANTAYLYKVRASSGGGDSGDSNIDLATTVIFTDPTLTPGTAAMKAVHITQLRTAVNAVRSLAGLGGASFTDAVLTPGTTLAKSAHVTELRTALSAARTQLGLSAVTFTDGSLTPGTTRLKAAHITELRDGVK